MTPSLLGLQLKNNEEGLGAQGLSYIYWSFSSTELSTATVSCIHLIQKGCFGHWQLGIGNWTFGHTKTINEMLYLSDRQTIASQCLIANAQSDLF